MSDKFDTPVSEHHHGHPEHPEEGAEVKITVNGESVPIHRGRRTVAEVKQAGHVPQAHDLEQVVCDELKPLPDDGSVTIKGGEVFVSHPKDAGSSR